MQFFPRLSKMARRVLEGRRLPQSDEDAVQNAFMAFFRRVERGEYRNGLRRDDLWWLLSMMTVQAARKLMIREGAEKRGGGNVKTESDIADLDFQATNLDALFGSVSTAECDMICEDLMGRLDDDQREIVILRLAGYTNLEIKSLLECSLRSIERRLQLVRAIWEASTQ